MHTHPDPQLYTAALGREERETSTPLGLSGGLTALLVLLALGVALAPRSPRRLSAHQEEHRRTWAQLRAELDASGIAPRSPRREVR